MLKFQRVLFFFFCNVLVTNSSPFSLHSQKLRFGTRLKHNTKRYITQLKEHTPIILYDVVNTATKSFARTAALRIPINLARTAVEHPPRLSNEEDCIEWLTDGLERGIRDGKCAAVKDGTRVLIRSLRMKEDIFNHLASVAVCDCYATYRHGPLAMSKQVVASLGSMLINREVRSVLFQLLARPPQSQSLQRIADSSSADRESSKVVYIKDSDSSSGEHHKHNNYRDARRRHNRQSKNNNSRYTTHNDIITIDNEWDENSSYNSDNAVYDAEEREGEETTSRHAVTSTASYNRTVESVNGTRVEERVEFTHTALN